MTKTSFKEAREKLKKKSRKNIYPYTNKIKDYLYLCTNKIKDYQIKDYQY